MNNLPANIQTAIAERNIDIAVWSTLQNSVFPGAKDESILLAVDYCKARKLDILKKPCHIVPMSVTDAKTGNKQWRDVIMPGIYEQRITAFRTGQMAGQDEPIFGDIVTFKGVDVPEWCRVTVYRFINGERCAFSHTEYFKEACATTKDGTLNSMWSKRPRGQLAKCAEAGALRKAFPDELGGVMTAEEINEDQPVHTEQPKSTVINAQAVELATPEQCEKINQLLELASIPVEKVLSRYGAKSVERLSKVQAESAIRKLNMTLDQISAVNSGDDDGEDVQL